MALNIAWMSDFPVFCANFQYFPATCQWCHMNDICGGLVAEFSLKIFGDWECCPGSEMTTPDGVGTRGERKKIPAFSFLRSMFIAS